MLETAFLCHARRDGAYPLRGAPCRGSAVRGRLGMPLSLLPWLWLLCLCLLWDICPARALADGAPVSAVEATYLYKLAAFVTWPPNTLPAHDFVICIAGDDPFGPALDRAVAGQSVQQRPVTVKRYGTIAANPGCQILFAAGGEQSVADELAAVSGAPVLTVTDGQTEDSPAGIVNFVLQGGFVRFELDPAAAAANNLGLSSKLLGIAMGLRHGTTP